MKMIDIQDHERDHIEADVSRAAGKYLSETGKASWTELTKEEWLGLLHTVVTEWEERPPF